MRKDKVLKTIAWLGELKPFDHTQCIISAMRSANS